MSKMVPKPEVRPTDQEFQKIVLEIRDTLQSSVEAAEELAGKETGYRNFEPLSDNVEKAVNLMRKYHSVLVWEHEI